MRQVNVKEYMISPYAIAGKYQSTRTCVILVSLSYTSYVRFDESCSEDGVNVRESLTVQI